MYSSKVRDHLRRNGYGIVAVFIALGGTAYAVDGPNPGQNTIGSEDIIGNEVKSDDIGNGRIFNLDIADEIIQSGKIKDGTLTGDDVALNTLGSDEIGSSLVIGADDGTGAAGDYEVLLDEADGISIKRYLTPENLQVLVTMAGGPSADQVDFVNGTDIDLNAGFLEFNETAQPTQPAVANAKVFLRDSGSGESELMIEFENGDLDVIATSDAP